MSLFGKKHEIDQNLNQAADAEAISSLFDKNMVITGTISFKGKARIDGAINGDITEGDHLILSESGKITGNIRTISFNCYGTLEGDVQASSVIARKTCSIHGRIEAASLTVEPGAAIDGEIRATAKDRGQGEERVQGSSSTSSAVTVDSDTP
ncbi:MAG: polymer-forming cytoskeletal protein [Desulfoprunum sp.]|uniref:bactofilin family protein n=1 Tax=Desulfoprunum sp. TaxID=2020866 RepID=UPI003C73C602